MKTRTTLFLLLLILAEYLHAADPKFYVILSPETKANSGYLNLLDSEFFNGLRKKFPCASSESQYSTKVLLDWEKQKQILGVEDKDQLLNIAEAMKYDYLVSLSVTVLENTTTISAFIMKKGPNNVISRTVESVPNGDAAINAAKKVSQKLIDDLYQYNSQLCREKTWTGTIKIEQHTYEKLLNADDPSKPGGSVKSDLSVQCEVNNDVAQCTVNYSEQLTGSEGNATTVASCTCQADVSISVFEGKTSISVGKVTANGTSSGSLAGGGFSYEINYPLGGWSVDAAIGTSTRSDSSSGSVNQGDLTITWSLNKK